MITWILFTLMAAFMQAWRNAFQKQLSTTVDVYGTTLARFIFSPIFAFSYLAFLYLHQPVTAPVHFSDKFWFYIVIAGISQIYATALMVKLFQQKNYAIGVGLAKSEAILAALVEGRADPATMAEPTLVPTKISNITPRSRNAL